MVKSNLLGYHDKKIYVDNILLPLQSLHTFALPALTQNYIALESVEQVRNLFSMQAPQPYWILGEGSNCIFVEDFLGTVLHNGLKGIRVTEDASAYLLDVASGENWHQLVQWCLQQEIYGFENLALIPGTIGAAPIQNIGAYGVEIATFIDRVKFIDLETATEHALLGTECQFGYRDSIFKNALANKVFITEVNFRLPKKWQAVSHYGPLQNLHDPKPMEIFNRVIEIRQSKLPDPKTLGNAGSFFKNPVISKTHFARLHAEWAGIPGYVQDDDSVKVPAAWLIDQLGFKGESHGGIRCHPQQPLVLTNIGNGRGDELLVFARQIRDSVKHRFAIELENEVRLVGKLGNMAL